MAFRGMGSGYPVNDGRKEKKDLKMNLAMQLAMDLQVYHTRQTISSIRSQG